MAVEVLAALGFEPQARALRQTPIRAANRYTCASKTLFRIELTLRAAHAGALYGTLQPHPRAIEAVGLVRVALDAVAVARGPLETPTVRWLETLRGRLDVLLRGRAEPPA